MHPEHPPTPDPAPAADDDPLAAALRLARRAVVASGLPLWERLWERACADPMVRRTGEPLGAAIAALYLYAGALADEGYYRAVARLHEIVAEEG